MALMSLPVLGSNLVGAASDMISLVNSCAMYRISIIKMLSPDVIGVDVIY